MSSTADDVLAAVRAATVPRAESDDRCRPASPLNCDPDQDPAAVATDGRTGSRGPASTRLPVVGLGPGGAGPRPPGPSAGRGAARRLLRRGLRAGRAVRPGRRRAGPAHRLLPRARHRSRLTRSPGGALSGFPPGCYVDPEPALEATPAWAIDRMHVPAAWVFSEQSGRPSRGEDVIVAQPDTGITPHVELVGVAFVPGFDVIDDDNDPTDPLTEPGNPGHGTGTASVLVSLDSYVVTGSAPQARLMPIRTIESVVRIRQITVARAIDWAIQEGAHVITMSLGGIPASALHRAIGRAVEADMIVLAAAGNCVRLVVWPARYDECIAVAATNAADQPWPGTCRGAPVDISAPGQNVYRAVVPPGGPTGADTVGQGQGTSFAVALTAGVAALWVAHHGRANVVAAAHARGETVQAMFRRLLQATARRPTPWDAQCDGPRDRGCARTSRGELRRGPWSRGGASRRPTRGPAPPRASRPWWRRPWAQTPCPTTRWTGTGSDRSWPPRCFGDSSRAHRRRSRAVSEPLARSISNPQLRDWLGLGASGA